MRVFLAVLAVVALAATASSTAAQSRSSQSSRRYLVVAYVQPDYKAIVEILGRTGLVERVVAKPEFGHEQAKWSPDGSMLAWTSRPGNGTSLTVERADGSGRRVLVKPSTCSHACVPLTFAWSPNGKRLLVGGAGKQTEQFLIVSAKSGRKVAIRRPRAWTEYRVIGWSSDGRTIAYLRNKRVGWNERLELFVSRSDGSGTKSLFRFASPEKDSPSASLSPDGRTIVFTTDHFDSHDPKVARVDTENGRVRVIRGLNPLLGVNPAWSPDGRTVAFPGRIVTMSANGTHRQSLGVGGDFVAWIPNGDLIIGKGARVLLSKKGQERPRLLFRLPKKQLSLYALDAATK